MGHETLQELVKKRKGYKFLKKDRLSPYQNYKYVFRKDKVFRTKLDKNTANNCGEGWNLATLDWILKNSSNILNQVIVEFSIPEDADIIIPVNSDGKFRTDTIKYEKLYAPEKLFPKLKELKKRLKTYKPINPITATEMPSEVQIQKILKEIWDSVRDSVYANGWASVWDSVRDSVYASIWPFIGNFVRASIWNCVGDPVRASVRASFWNCVGDPTGDSVVIISYYAIKLFMNFEYEHPVFDLIRLGIIVIKVDNKFKVFGKNGTFLGEFNDSFLC